MASVPPAHWTVWSLSAYGETGLFRAARQPFANRSDLPGIGRADMRRAPIVKPDLSLSFPAYSGFAPHVPVWCVTPDLGGCFHRFFDTSPVSPSGRYLGLTRFAPEDRMPVAGEPAEVVLVDLQTGRARTVAETRGWDTQLGAQVQWGATDHELFYNDMDVPSWVPFGVKLDPETGRQQRLGGPVYMVSPDGRWAASPCLLRTGSTQAGYGVLAPAEHVPVNHGAASDDGLFVTDCTTGRCRLLLSFRHIAEAVFGQAVPGAADLYGFHVKWNPQGTRLQFVVRHVPRDGGRILPSLITCRPDGSELALAIPAEEWGGKGGHHPNWCPDGETILMNLNLGGDGMRFIRVNWDGTGLRAISRKVLGSGHPTLHPGGRIVVTDAYPHERVAFDDGTTPIRWVDLTRETVANIVRIRTVPDYPGPRKERRVDPHPAWDPTWTRLVFNACPDGRRQVFMADVSALLP